MLIFKVVNKIRKHQLPQPTRTNYRNELTEAANEKLCLIDTIGAHPAPIDYHAVMSLFSLNNVAPKKIFKKLNMLVQK